MNIAELRNSVKERFGMMAGSMPSIEFLIGQATISGASLEDINKLSLESNTFNDFQDHLLVLCTRRITELEAQVASLKKEK